MKKNKKKKSGFTLVEVLAVLIIVAILAGVGTPIYLEYVKSARASDAQTTIGAIHTAAKIYYQKRERYPKSIEELEIKIDEATKLYWKFEIGASGDRITTIQATSTDDMPGGAGKVVLFDAVKGKFTGYGVD